MCAVTEHADQEGLLMSFTGELLLHTVAGNDFPGPRVLLRDGEHPWALGREEPRARARPSPTLVEFRWLITSRPRSHSATCGRTLCCGNLPAPLLYLQKHTVRVSRVHKMHTWNGVPARHAPPRAEAPLGGVCAAACLIESSGAASVGLCTRGRTREADLRIPLARKEARARKEAD